MNVKTLTAVMLSACAGVAGAAWEEGYDPYTMAPTPVEETFVFDDGTGVEPIYSTPGTSTSAGVAQHAFVPNDVYFEYLGNMSISGQGGRVRVSNVFVSMPLISSGRVSWGGWHLDAKASARLTWLDTSGQNILDEDRLYTVGMNVSVSHAVGRNGQFRVGFTPQLSSDFDVMSADNFYWGGYVAYSSKAGDRLRYTLGLALMPDFYENYVFPVMNISWRYAPAWEMRVQASRISAVCVARQNFEWGPFFQWNSGIWTVHRKGQTRQFRMTDCIAGMGGNYMVNTGRFRMNLLGDLGMTFYNTFRVRDKHGDRTFEKYRTHPGLYLRLGVQVQF